jgi:hypothetical protein
VLQHETAPLARTRYWISELLQLIAESIFEHTEIIDEHFRPRHPLAITWRPHRQQR